MFLFILLSLCLITLMVGPIIYAYRSESTAENIPKIQHDNTRNPRYFSLSFKKLFSSAMSDYDNSGTLHLSTDEPVLFADDLEFQDQQEYHQLIIQKNGDLQTGSGTIFHKEIYAGQDATIGANTQLRAIACEKDLTLEEQTTVYRWADAEGTLRVKNQVDLGISTTSAHALLVGEQCTFKRLYAPLIRLGLTAEQIQNIPLDVLEAPSPTVVSDIERDLISVNDENTNSDGAFPHTIVTKHALKVFKGFQVQGDIRSHKSVLIDDDVIVHGNIFAEGQVTLGKNTKVYGNVFTQENITLLEGASIGRSGVTKSVVARGNIVFDRNCTVHGYVSTEGVGSIRPFAQKG